MARKSKEPTAPAPSVDEVTGLLRGVIDPELGSDIVTLGMVPEVAVTVDGTVTLTVKLTIAGCPLRGQIKSDVETRIGTHPGVRTVDITWGEMTSEERSGVMVKARWAARELAPDTRIPATTRVLAIASGKGGVGKSSVTVNLAAAIAAQGHTVGVLDADIWGFSVPRMLGIPDRLEARKDAEGRSLIQPNVRSVGTGTLKVVSTGNLVDDEGTALMWRGLMLTKAVEQFLRDVAWGSLDYLIIDMPPGTGDVSLTLSQIVGLAGAIVVCTPQQVALLDAVKAISMFRQVKVPLLGIVENMTGEIFGRGGAKRKAEELGIPFLGELPIDAGIRIRGDDGRIASLFAEDNPSRGPLLHICEQAAIELARQLLETPRMPTLEIL